jgi:HNH endonuclease
MERNALKDLISNESWRVQKAHRTLANLPAAHTEALPMWLNRLLAEPKNNRRDFKILRAYRRGLLHYDRPQGWGYPTNWKEVASRIRKLDNFRCVVCAAQDRVIDVHHIIYASNFGTHQQANLVSLCRPCHEAEHERTFDLGEASGEYYALSASHPPPAQPSPPPPRSPPPITAELPRSATINDSHIPIRAVPQPERFCGHCRSLVIPMTRFLWIKRCPNCGYSI